VFNLGSQRGFSNLEVMRACAEVTGTELPVVFGPPRAGDPPTLVASSEAARSELGWAPERDDLITMIADAWRWHSRHPDGYGRA
jgi:UDP-glucose 4-epimerase